MQHCIPMAVFFGIMSICTVLNWSAVKSRLNTVLSYHAILANVSIAECVQIWSRVMEMSDSQCSLSSWLVSFLRVLILFLPTLLLSNDEGAYPLSQKCSEVWTSEHFYRQFKSHYLQFKEDILTWSPFQKLTATCTNSTHRFFSET